VPRARRPARLPAPRAARLVLVLLTLEVLAFLLSTVPGVRGALGFEVAGFDPFLDGWLQGAGYVTAAVLALLRPFSAPVDRAIWAWLAAAVTARALGFVVYLGYVRWQQPPPYPSAADAAWLAMYVPMLAGLVELARRRAHRLSTTLLLDATVGVLAAAALAVALLYRTVLSLAAPGTPGVVVGVNLAYPVLDLMLLVVFVGVLLAYEWQPPPAAWVLAAGVTGFAVIDGIFVYQSAAGTFRPGTFLSSAALLVMALVAVAGWLPAQAGPLRREPLPNVVLPGFFALTCLGLLVYASRMPIPVAGVALAGAGVAVAIARTGLSFHALRSLAEHRREARTDGRWPAGPPTGGWRCWSWTSTTSRRSTTPSATTTATSSSAWRRRGSSRRCARATSSPGSAVTSSPSCSPTPTAHWRSGSPSGCMPASAGPSSWGPGPS
jgi:hypothetical protein